MIAAVEPDAPTAVATSNEDAVLRVSWTAPTNTGGNSIALTAYRVTLRKADSTYTQVSECDGSQAGILAAAQCDISMSALTGELGLSLGDQVFAIVYASNSVGEGSASTANSVDIGIVQQAPSKPSSPPLRDSATTISSLVVDITALSDPDNGKDDIISYNIEMSSDGGSNFSEVQGETSDSLLLTATVNSGIT